MSKKKQISVPALKAAPLLSDAPDLGDAPDLPDAPDLADAGSTPDAPGLASLNHPASAMTTMTLTATATASGESILALARQHIGETYILGARAPMGNPNWKGPWDCAEFVSWCVFQASGVLYGTEPRNNPMLADAFTGFWARQAAQGGHTIDVALAARIPGAAVLRKPQSSQIGHIVFSDGKGGTVEAHSSKRGVIADTLSGRRWDFGILVPGVNYTQSDTMATLAPAPQTLRLTQPPTRGDRVKAVQRRLAKLGFAVGTIDGIYGPQTAHAVRLFQAQQGLVADGEVGPATTKALKP